MLVLSDSFRSLWRTGFGVGKSRGEWALMQAAVWHTWAANLSAHGILLACLVALSVLCLVQSLLLWRLKGEESRSTATATANTRALNARLHDLRLSEKLLLLENQTLQSLIRERDPWRAVDLLLRQFVPDARAGFAAILELRDGAQRVLCSRGLSQLSRHDLRLDRSLEEALAGSLELVLDSREVVKTELWSTLSQEDRQKVCRLFLVAERTESSTVLSLLATHLPVPEAGLKQRIALARRLLSAAVARLDEMERARSSQSELRETKERLEIRTLVDRHFATPLKMLEVTLQKLLDSVQAQRGAVVVVGPDRSARTVVRCGARLPAGVDRQLQRWEEWLAAAKAGVSRPVALTERELRQLGVESLIRSALVVPAYRKEGSAGVVVVTRQSDRPFEDGDVSLAEWTGKLLHDTLSRAVDLATVQRQARQDGLTELANRRAFDEEIARQLTKAARSGRECSLLLFDLDRFKSINDRYGHLAGDEVLRASAAVIRQAMSKVRSGDKVFLARYGGEELAGLLPGFGTAGAVRVAESARSAVERTVIPFEEHVLQVTVSVGVATFPIHAQSAEELIAAADQALYEAKRSGRNRVCVAEVQPAPTRL